MNLKEGEHVPRVSHEQGEFVYMDLVGPISPKISSAKYLLTMIGEFARFDMVCPFKSKSAKEMSEVAKRSMGISQIFSHRQWEGVYHSYGTASNDKLGIHFPLGGQTIRSTPFKEPIEHYTL